MSGPGAAFRKVISATVLVTCGLAALMAQLAPLGPLPDAPIPDLFWCVLSFFALRRPEATPLLLVFGLTLTRDALLGGPLGAGALSLMLGTEILRLRARMMPAPRSVLGDWAAAALVYAGAVGLQWLLMALTFAQPPSPMALAPHVASTALAIPVVAVFLRYVLRLGASPREADA